MSGLCERGDRITGVVQAIVGNGCTCIRAGWCVFREDFRMDFGIRWCIRFGCDIGSLRDEVGTVESTLI